MSSSYEDRQALRMTLNQLERVQTEFMMQVFRKEASPKMLLNLLKRARGVVLERFGVAFAAIFGEEVYRGRRSVAAFRGDSTGFDNADVKHCLS